MLFVEHKFSAIQMESVKDILNFCNAAIFYIYKNVGITCEMNEVRKCIINGFYKTITHSRILVSLSIIDDIILKIMVMKFKKLLKKNHDLRENILNMLSFEKLVNDKQQIIRPIFNDDDDQQQS